VVLEQSEIEFFDNVIKQLQAKYDCQPESQCLESKIDKFFGFSRSIRYPTSFWKFFETPEQTKEMAFSRF
jgi:hypothetical protein